MSKTKSCTTTQFLTPPLLFVRLWPCRSFWADRHCSVMCMHICCSSVLDVSTTTLQWGSMTASTKSTFGWEVILAHQTTTMTLLTVHTNVVIIQRYDIIETHSNVMDRLVSKQNQEWWSYMTHSNVMDHLVLKENQEWWSRTTRSNMMAHLVGKNQWQWNHIDLLVLSSLIIHHSIRLSCCHGPLFCAKSDTVSRLIKDASNPGACHGHQTTTLSS
jgi:hypothetical protein